MKLAIPFWDYINYLREIWSFACLHLRLSLFEAEDDERLRKLLSTSRKLFSFTNWIWIWNELHTRIFDIKNNMKIWFLDVMQLSDVCVNEIFTTNGKLFLSFIMNFLMSFCWTILTFSCTNVFQKMRIILSSSRATKSSMPNESSSVSQPITSLTNHPT